MLQPHKPEVLVGPLRVLAVRKRRSQGLPCGPLRAGSNIGPHLPRFLPWDRGEPPLTLSASSGLMHCSSSVLFDHLASADEQCW